MHRSINNYAVIKQAWKTQSSCKTQSCLMTSRSWRVQRVLPKKRRVLTTTRDKTTRKKWHLLKLYLNLAAPEKPHLKLIKKWRALHWHFSLKVRRKIEPARVRNNGDILGLIFVTSYDVKFTQRVSNKIR